MSNPSGSADKSGEVCRTTIRVPPFWPEQPTIWFKQIEAQFTLNGITVDNTKFCYVMSQLEPRYALEVQDILENPPETNRYEMLRRELIRRLSASQGSRIRQLLEQEEIGDRTPSQFLRHMRNLSGTTVTDDFLRTLWSSRLPAVTRAVISGQADLSLDKLAEIADAIHAEGVEQKQVAAINPSDRFNERLLQRLEKLEHQIASLAPSRSGRASSSYRRSGSRFSSRSKSRSSSRSSSRSGGREREDHAPDGSRMCWYHRNYAGAREGGGRRYPVIVFVHGESYEWSSGNPYDGSVLASYGGVIVVTINYRLGILGFLNANTDSHLRSPANYGLMDQIAALHWVQENIGYFGGDPRNVTLIGHGTGAACVNFLMTSHAVPDGLLFHRSVLMSGSALSPWALVRGAATYAQQVAEHLNCSWAAGNPQALLRCLREVPLNALVSVPVKGLEFAPAFGPSIDGVVIDPGDPEDQDFTVQVDTINTLNNILLRKDAVAKLSRYDLMIGVVRSEAYFSLTANDAQYGIEADRRTKILREFVRNTYTYHQAEILATIINEYTDWERPVQHPVNIKDETLEALGDANTVAPATRTADLHSQSHRNSYLYVFDYQTKFGDYPQRPGCIHGEDLPYFFGAPIVGGLSHWPKNYTKAEIALSESVILYLTNFARTGNPNEGTSELGSFRSDQGSMRSERNKFKNIDWTAYEAVHKKYLSIELKSKLKNHYRAHRLSFWLNLVPDLHKPGSDDVPRSHHLLDTEQVPPRFIQRIPTTTRTTTAEVTVAEKTVNVSTAIPSELAFEDTTSQPEDGFAAYSTALSVTIAIGCSLLILNVLIFAGVYYQRDKSNQHNCSKKRQENGQMPNNICGDLETKTAERHHIQHIPPPEFADLQNNSCHVPMPPPPPKNTKPGKPGQNLIISPNQLQQESMAMTGTGTLKKGHNHQQQVMDELRV